MMNFRKPVVMCALGAVVGLGSAVAARAVVPDGVLARPQLGSPQGRVFNDYAEYAFGPEGYVAQSDVIVRGQVTRVLNGQTHAGGGKGGRHYHQLEVEVDETLYRNTERQEQDVGRSLVISVPAASADVSMGRTPNLTPGGTHLFFLRRSPFIPGAYVLLRGEHGVVDLQSDLAHHEVLGGTTPSAILDEVRRYAALARVSVPVAKRESLEAVPQGVQPGRFYERSSLPAGARQSLRVQEEGVVMFGALPEGMIASRPHVVTLGDRCFVRLQWVPGAASGPVAIHFEDAELPRACEALLDKAF
ncbi:hypothetical protein F0U61_10155 [Archangium violaceum]|uniref:hypothetical protein n=1 Tax=Archangium violaceum TaxID=83451 RepID=UPI002B324F72|nr:hypothetical protein F0U61_10155 [Archangium violaceum]